ncbi:class I adenylate-forming enzyme family protein [Dyadobacter sp. CY323]|uniref:class I adenylate-forming enzyme family protein n=1 Tax=Dyadobacter sp. CY323 TaxID=2907302 RepID=UPI001F2BF227|nr:class I adenylate-forming enzyme family protein [Dyadobacter sp. CY323]MCE6991842.1 acyl--CoA ligase [Dyadobacter sp. CY323]
MTHYTNYFVEALRNRIESDIILYEGGKSITAGLLLNSAYSLATALHDSGVNKGDKVVMAVKPGIEFLQVMYANMMVGTIISIIDPEMGRENYLQKLKQFAPDHAFVDSKLILLNEHPVLKFAVLRLNKTVPSFPRIKNCQLFTTGTWLPLFQKHKKVARLIKGQAPTPDFTPIEEKSDFLITYTSGTLSEPKGVVHHYSGLSNSIKHLTKLLLDNKDEILATHLPHYALLGINAGIKVYLWDNKMDPASKIRFIIERNITTLFGPPSDFIPIINYLNQKASKFPDCVRNIYLGSAPIYNPFLSKLVHLSDTLKITCMYGMTENLLVTIQDGRRKLADTTEGDLVGKPLPNVQLSIADDGEICIQSDQIYSHYWQMEKTQDLHFTGDIGKIDDLGRLILLGRKKYMMIRGNFNIYPGLYEPTIHKIDGVKEAVMVGIYNDEKADEDIILVIDGEEKLNETMVMKQLITGKYSIDKEALPDRIIFRPIPHSGRQAKIDRKQLVQQLTAENR